MAVLDLPKWFDLHAHFRQGRAMAAYVEAHWRMGCAGVLAMPNTLPPVARVVGPANEKAWSIESYRKALCAAGAERFEQLIIPLYLTRETTVAMIEEGAGLGSLQACKYYPPHGTTNSEFGVPLEELSRGSVLKAMEETGTVLCIHGEAHGLQGEQYFDASRSAESVFYEEVMPGVVEAYPDLKIVCEHVTSQAAVNFVRSAGARVAATVTPQHLLFTVGHLIQGLRYHLYCLPIVKFSKDREALREAVTDLNQQQFFAGTDSAPHTTKATECGCAAGCFTGGCAPQLYAQAFEEAGVDLLTPSGTACFERFLCRNGPDFYGFPLAADRIQLEPGSESLSPLVTPEGRVIPLPIGMEIDLKWRLAGAQSDSERFD